MIRDESVASFLEKLSSKEPVPGGGGAAALAGAEGAALASMVFNLTIGKKAYAAYDAELKEGLRVSGEVRELFLDLADRDEEVFLPLSKAYAMKKDTPEEQAERDRVMEEALVNAALSPMETLRTAVRFLDTVKKAAEYGSKLAVSDASVSASFLRTAISGSSINVRINTRMMKNEKVAKELEKSRAALLSEGLRKADEIIAIVDERLK